jgi:DNA-binding IclR family transcriptional regulator
MHVWEAVRLHTQWNTGLMQATVSELAEDAGTNHNEVYRALSRLVEIGALRRTGRGRYAINPDAGWAGTLASREAARAESLSPEA